MKWLPRKIRARIEAAEKAADQNEARLEQTRRRIHEVRELASWSIRTVETNHLTQLFQAGIRGKA